mgnify:FL=1
MQAAKSVVISCAGIGSRLGLGTTKALINIHGKSLIRWQLELFQEAEDIRVVVGFEAQKVIDEVRQYRPDAIFVFNHNYFETKTGASYHLGARDGNAYALACDGDVLVHPDDMKKLWEAQGEWIAYADKMSEDAVFVRVDEQGAVLSFSREAGDYEWTGPCCLKKEHVVYTSGYVYNQLEPHLPLPGIKIRACDIDTYADYERALKFVESWP